MNAKKWSMKGDAILVVFSTHMIAGHIVHFLSDEYKNMLYYKMKKILPILQQSGKRQGLFYKIDKDKLLAVEYEKAAG